MTTADRILLRAEDLEWPPVIVGGGQISGEPSWRRAVELPGDHPTLLAQLEAAEAAAQATAERSTRWAVEDAERERVRTPDPALAAAERAEAEAVFARYERERPKRVEELLRRAVELLEKGNA